MSPTEELVITYAHQLAWAAFASGGILGIGSVFAVAWLRGAIRASRARKAILTSRVILHRI